MRFSLWSATLLAWAFNGCSTETTIPGRDSRPADGRSGRDLAFVQPDGPTLRDAAPSDKSALRDEGIADGALPLGCAGKQDGTSCDPAGAPGLICLGQKCVSSTCGDKFTDTATGEQCDDGNTVTNDGCSACRLNCKSNPDCDDKVFCNGVETCNTTTHACVAATWRSNGTACQLPAGGSGACNGGVCATAGCGNGIRDAGEDCDDKNQVNGDGCDNDCRYSCLKDADCDDRDACNGKETCDLAQHKCKAGLTLVCDDKKTCTADSCDAVAGCVNTPLDLDNDGRSCDDDCNDADPAIYKGAPECADGKDNDCDGAKDEAPLVSGTCWQDQDGDTYAPLNAPTINSCACPAGYTGRNPSLRGSVDCNDALSSVNQGQTSWFSAPLCSRPAAIQCWDYNCNGLAEKRYPDVAAGATCMLQRGGGACVGSGWVGVAAAPSCGDSAKYRTCSLDSTNSLCLASESVLKQECH